jgi:hypothetical protein
MASVEERAAESSDSTGTATDAVQPEKASRL